MKRALGLSLVCDPDHPEDGSIKYILITNQVDVAQQAVRSGVDRIFVDLEILGKESRQGHLDTLISRHSMSDVRPIADVIGTADLIVRLNPFYENTAEEVEQAIQSGAKTLMLPMFHDAKTVINFSELVDGRASVLPLIETSAALNDLDSILELKGVEEVYIGLNDLHLDLVMTFMFEPVANGMIDQAAEKIQKAGKRFGFGGIARCDEGMVPGRMVLAEHLRLGSSSVILSRTFQGDPQSFDADTLGTELNKLRQAETALAQRCKDEIETGRTQFNQAVAAVVAAKS